MNLFWPLAEDKGDHSLLLNRLGWYKVSCLEQGVGQEVPSSPRMQVLCSN